jgi:hypothetical protein
MARFAEEVNGSASGDSRGILFVVSNKKGVLGTLVLRLSLASSFSSYKP